MLVLFDRAPPDLTTLEFTLPPHQQTFVIGSDLDLKTKELTITHGRIYACEPEKLPGSEIRRMPLGDHPKRSYKDLVDFEARTMKVEAYATAVFDYLEANMNKKVTENKEVPEMFNEKGPTSAILALQLNEPIHTLQIKVSDSPEGKEVHPISTYSPRRAAFTFHVPEFPAEEYRPTSALPPPARIVKEPATQLHRQTTPPILPLAGPFLARTHLLTAQPNPHASLRGGRPRFAGSIYPFEHDCFVPANRAIPPDLIVSIVLSADQRGLFSWTLKEIEVKLPLGSREEDDSLRPPKLPDDQVQIPRPLVELYSTHNEPIPTMLSNLRFDVLRRFDTKEKNMVLSVVARSRKGVNVKAMTEASFLLPMVNVIRWPGIPEGKQYVANVIVTASYILPNQTDVVPYVDTYSINIGLEGQKLCPS